MRTHASHAWRAYMPRVHASCACRARMPRAVTRPRERTHDMHSTHVRTTLLCTARALGVRGRSLHRVFPAYECSDYVVMHEGFRTERRALCFATVSVRASLTLRIARAENKLLSASAERRSVVRRRVVAPPLLRTSRSDTHAAGRTLPVATVGGRRRGYLGMRRGVPRQRHRCPVTSAASRRAADEPQQLQRADGGESTPTALIQA